MRNVFIDGVRHSDVSRKKENMEKYSLFGPKHYKTEIF